MTANTYISDGTGDNHKTKVTSRGQLVVAPLDYSTFYLATAAAINTGYTVVPPVSGKRFVITAIILYANKNVGTNDATVSLYESTSENSRDVETLIFQQEMPRKVTLSLIGLNIIVGQSRWVNIKTDDNSIFANIAGYYIDA